MALWNPMLMKQAVTVAPVISCTYSTTRNVTSGVTTYHASALAIGAANATREVVLVVILDQLGASVSSAFFNTSIATTVSHVTIGSVPIFALVQGLVPTGTTVTIDVNFSQATADNTSLAVYYLNNRTVPGAAPYDTESGTIVGTSLANTGIDAPDQSFVVAVCTRTDNAEVLSLSGLGTAIDVQSAATTARRVAYAHSTLQSPAVSGGSLTWTWTTSQTGHAATWTFS